MKLSEVLSQQIICLAEAKSLGMIFSCTADRRLRKIKQLALADGDEVESYIPLRYVLSGKDVLFTVNHLTEYEKQGITIPLRAEVFDTDGARLGRIGDFEFDKSGITSILLTTGKALSPQNVIVATEGLVVTEGTRRVKAAPEKKILPAPQINDALNVPPRVKKAENGLENKTTLSTVGKAFAPQGETEADSKSVEPSKTENKDDNKQESFNTVEQTENAFTAFENTSVLEENGIADVPADNNTEARHTGPAAAGSTAIATAVQPLPSYREAVQPSSANNRSAQSAQPGASPVRLISGYAFLLGRRVIKQITANGSLLIPNGKIVDVETVELARKNGKLVELTVSSVE